MAKKKAKKKVGWGGARKGAGGKPKPDGQTGKVVSFYLYPADQVALDRVRVSLNCTQNEALRRCIREKDERIAEELLAARKRKKP